MEADGDSLCRWSSSEDCAYGYAYRSITRVVPRGHRAFGSSDGADHKCGIGIGCIVEDNTGDPIPGASIRVSWQGGEEAFFTGLYPVISPGYADYEMTPGEQYRVQIGTGGVMVSEIDVPSCTGEEGEDYSGGWYLRFAPSNQSTMPIWIT